MSDMTCRKCGQITPCEEMAVDWRSGKPSSVCKHCTRKDAADRNREYRKRNRAVVNARLAVRRAAKRDLTGSGKACPT